MQNRNFTLVTLLCGLLVLPADALAQATGAIHGAVYDQAGTVSRSGPARHVSG